MPDVLFNLLLLFSAVMFIGILLRAWRVTLARKRNAGTKSSGGDGRTRDDPETAS